MPRTFQRHDTWLQNKNLDRSYGNLFKHKNLRGRLARWFVTLQDYDVSFEFIPGKKNSAADALSRNITSESEDNLVVCSVQELLTLNNELISTEQSDDETWKELTAYLKNPTQSQQPKLPGKYNANEFQLINGLLYRNTELNNKEVSRRKVRQLVIPRKLVQDVLKLLHGSAYSSHPGKDKIYKQAQLKYFWPLMRKDIYDHVDNCITSSEVKGHTRAPAPILLYPLPQKPWERVVVAISQS